MASTIDDLVEAASDLGWPERKVVIKPPGSNGMRGVRIIDEAVDLKRLYYEEKPSSLCVRMDHMRQVLGGEFPELMVMEHLPGTEYTVDVFHGDDILAIPRRRDRIVSGITFAGTVERREDIIQSSERLARSLGLDYAFGFQYKLDNEGTPKLLECNPRVQGTMVLSTLAGANMIYAAVMKALGEPVPSMRVTWGTRLMRYWGGIGVADGRLAVRI
jgi:carbamoyl-phosphate synthase large subunit